MRGGNEAKKRENNWRDGEQYPKGHAVGASPVRSHGGQAQLALKEQGALGRNKWEEPGLPQANVKGMRVFFFLKKQIIIRSAF